MGEIISSQKDRARANARRRGRGFEQKMARITGGHIHAGQDGDVEARGYRIECKYRSDLQLESSSTLRDWIEQVKRYQLGWDPSKRWAIAVTGGQQQRSEVYMIIPFGDWDRLTKAEEERTAWEQFVKAHPDLTERASAAVQQLARDYLHASSDRFCIVRRERTPVIYRFTDEELYDCWQLARQRNQKTTRFGMHPGNWGRKSSLEIHYEGIVAELAVARLLGLDINRHIFDRGGDNQAPDLVLPDGRTIEVKFRGRKGDDFALRNTNRDSFKADLGVLVWPHDEESVEIAGYITRDDFVANCVTVNYIRKRGGDRLAVSSSHLRPFSELLEGVSCLSVP
jgi:hypothetical protein